MPDPLGPFGILLPRPRLETRFLFGWLPGGLSGLISRERRPLSGWPSPLRLLLLSGVLAAAAPGQTGEDLLPASVLKGMSVEQLLEQQVVSVSRRPEQWGQAASSVFLIRGGAPSTTGAVVLPELLRLAPNLFVAQSSSHHWGITARGFMRASAFSNKLLVLVDGRTVYSPFFSNVFWDSLHVFHPDLDRIEVISGPAGSAWGSNAVNGVINILTKRAHATQGSVIFAGAGTEMRGAFGARYGGRFGRTGAFRVYASGHSFDSSLDAAGADDNRDEWGFVQAGFRADWGYAHSGEFTVQGDAYQGRYDSGSTPQIRADGANLHVRWSRRISPTSSLLVRAYHDYVMRDTQQAIVQRTDTSDVEMQHQFELGDRHEFLWGASYRRMHDQMGETTGFVILPERLTFDLGTLFAQHDLTFRDARLRLTTGMRIENNHFSGWEHQPSLRLAWRPDSANTFWAAGSRVTRTPSRLEVGFFAPEEPPFAIAGGPGFESEVLEAYELGWRGQPTATIAVTATLFLHEYDDLRSVELTSPIVQANRGEGRSYGAEVFVDWDVTPTWRLRAGGFWIGQDTWNEPGSLDSERALGEISFPGAQFQLRNTFRIRPWLSFWTGLRWVDDVPGFENNTFGRVPAYTELDASLNWVVRPGLELSLSGRNLLDASHPEIGLDASRREIERSVRALIQWAF